MSETSQAAALQRRIIEHMNRDHQDSLAMYLRVYCKVNPRRAATARLEEVQLAGLRISTVDKTHFFVPFNPPLSSFDQVRKRTVEMHHHCLAALNLSDIAVTEYRGPTGFPAMVFTACLVTFALFARRGNFVEGSLMHRVLFRHVPPFAWFCYTIQPLLITIMTAIHLTEATYMAIYKLRPHRVPLFSRLWWAWTINIFIEGVTCMKRFDAIVQEKRDRQQQHKPVFKRE